MERTTKIISVSLVVILIGVYVYYSQIHDWYANDVLGTNQVTHTFDDIFADPDKVLDVTCPRGHAINYDFDFGASCVNIETNIALLCSNELVLCEVRSISEDVSGGSLITNSLFGNSDRTIICPEGYMEGYIESFGGVDITLSEPIESCYSNTIHNPSHPDYAIVCGDVFVNVEGNVESVDCGVTQP